MAAAPAAESPAPASAAAAPAAPMDVDPQETTEQIKLEANDLFRDFKFAESIVLYSKAIDIDPDTNATLYCNRAAAFLAIDKFSDALADCSRSIKIEPDFVKAHFRSAKCHVHLGQIDAAIADLRRIQPLVHSKDNLKRKVTDLSESLAKELRNVTAIKRHLDAFERYMSRKNYTSALISIDSACIIVDPSLRSTGPVSSVSSIDSTRMSKICLNWQFMRADALVGAWDVDEAVRIAHYVLVRDPRNINGLILRARTMHLLDSHPVSTVQQYLSQALAFDPDNQKARSLLKRIKLLESVKKAGNEAFGKSNWTEALDEYAKYLELDPDGGIVRAKVLSNRANVYSKIGKHKEALEDVQDALNLLDSIGFPTSILGSAPGSNVSNRDRQMSTNSPLYYKLILRAADSHLKLEEFDIAIADYQKAMEIKPDSKAELAQAIRNAKKMQAIANRKDYYKILGCTKSASESEIKKAYRKMALQCHPDKLVGMSDEDRAVAEVKFKEIGEAYEVLSDSRKKSLYDMGHDVDGSSASGGMRSGGFPSDMYSNIFTQHGFSSGAGFSGFGGGGHGYHDHDHSGHSDFDGSSGSYSRFNRGSGNGSGYSGYSNFGHY